MRDTDITKHKPFISQFSLKSLSKFTYFVPGHPNVAKEENVWTVLENSIDYSLYGVAESAKTNIEVANYERGFPEIRLLLNKRC